MHTAAAYFASKMPDKPEAQEDGIQSVENHVQNLLNAGETADFNLFRPKVPQHKMSPV